MLQTPKRIVSLQPSVTSTLERLGMLDRVVACTKYCVDVCPTLRADPKMIVADSWTAQHEQILAAKPDLVIASVPYQLEAVAEIMKAGVAFLGLAPKSLEDIYSDIARIAWITGAIDRGDALLIKMKNEVDDMKMKVQEVSARKGGKRPLVYCEEWGKPLIHSQKWVAELVYVCGGTFLGTPGSHADDFAIRDADPEVIITAWCGAGDRVPLEKIIPQRGWQDTQAAKNRNVFCIRDEYLNTPGPTVIQGLHALAEVIHGIPVDLEFPPRRINAA